MPRLEPAENADQFVAVVIGMGHQMAAAHVEPRDAIEKTAEMPLDRFQRQMQMMRTRLAEHVEMKPFDTRRQLPEFAGGDAEARTGHARIVEVRLDGRILRIDPQSARDAAQKRHRSETLELRHGVERNVVAAPKDLPDVAVGVDRSIGVGRTAVFLEYEPCSGCGTGRGAVGMAGQLGENTPHRACLERYDDLGAGRRPHAVDLRQIRVQQRLVENETRRRQFLKINHLSGPCRLETTQKYEIDPIGRILRAGYLRKIRIYT